MIGGSRACFRSTIPRRCHQNTLHPCRCYLTKVSHQCRLRPDFSRAYLRCTNKSLLEQYTDSIRL